MSVLPFCGKALLPICGIGKYHDIKDLGQNWAIMLQDVGAKNWQFRLLRLALP
jgi:hypothetical protein